MPPDRVPVPRGRAPAYGVGVEVREPERLGSLAGLLASVAVGVPMLLDTARTGGELIVGPVALWWVSYLGYLVVFALYSQVPEVARPRWLRDRVLLPVQGVAGALAFALTPRYGWMAVLLVVTAASVAYDLPRRATAGVVAAQMVLAAVVTAQAQLPPLEAVLAVVIYTSFQVFAVFAIWAQQREAAARERLAEAHAQLRATTAMLEASSRSAERLRIARDLHDLVGHQLTALALELEVASRTGAGPGDAHVGRARTIAKELLADVREAVGELRAPKRELREALNAVLDGLPGPQIHLEVADDVRVDDETVLALVRCVQEVVTNTVRHADAERLDVEVARLADGGVRLAAQDDGRGAAVLRPGNGLASISERIEGLGGTVRFDTQDGRGMRVVAEIPGR